MNNWKENLVVLETQNSWHEHPTALLFDPSGKHSRYIVAYSFNESNREWSHGDYYSDLSTAIYDFYGKTHSEYTIEGCTPDDVLEVYGDEYSQLDYNDARQIACNVNKVLSHMDDLYAEDLYCAVEEYVRTHKKHKRLEQENKK